MKEMDNIQKISLSVDIAPRYINDKKNYVTKHITENIANTIYKGFCIKDILYVSQVGNGKILLNGYARYSIEATCVILDPKIGEIYSTIISYKNKLGLFSKSKNLTIMIPNHFCHSRKVYEVGDSINIKIVGKRIEQNITCVAEEVIIT